MFQLQQTVPNIQQSMVPSLPPPPPQQQPPVPKSMQPSSTVQPVEPIAPVVLVMPVQYQQPYFVPTPTPQYVDANEEIVTFSTGTQ